MRSGRERAVRLDQAVSRVLVRLGALAVMTVVVAVSGNLWRTALYSRADTFIAADQALAMSHAGMLDQETGLRGYLDSRDPSLLDPYYAGLREVSTGDAGLAIPVSGDASLVDRYVSLRLAQNTWETQWVARAVTLSAGIPLGFLNAGKHLFDAYRTDETALNDAILSRVSLLQAEAGTIAGAMVLAEVVLLAAGAVLWWRSRLHLRRAVVGPVRAILGHLDRIEGGDFAPEESVAEGPSELRTISQRLAVVGQRLERTSADVRRREADAAEHAARLHLMLEMGRHIAGSLSVRYVLQAVSDSVSGIAAFERCVIWLADASNTLLTPVHDSRGIKGRVTGLEPVAVGEQVVGRAARFGRVTGPEPVSRPDVDQPWESAVAVPMVVGGRTVGVIELAMDGRADLSTVVMELVHTLSSQAATALEAARLYEQAEQRGRTDALTLLPNRRELEPALRIEVSRAQRYSRPLSIAMVDIDHFKAVNDTYGHARGDEVLQETASVMRALLRDVDTVYRYGGEEFLVLMPETDIDAAFTLLDRLRNSIAERVRVRAGEAVTVSAGVASLPRDGDTPAELIAAADALLYRAKSEGRNRVAASERSAPLAAPRLA